MKIKQNLLFWILQITGWGTLASLSVFGKIVSNAKINENYVYAEGLLFFISALIATSVVRKYLKNKLSFDKFQSSDLKILFIALLIGSGLLFFSIFIAIPLYSFFNESALNISGLEVFSSLINIILFVFFWLVIYYFVKLYRKFNQNKVMHLELESALKESQLNTLKGQINPHFMFNSLNNIRGLMLEDVDKSREMITRLSEMLRYSLTKNDVNKIALSEELEMVENYIELSKIQLEDRLTFEKQIDNNLLKYEIPPMLIQMLVENAVKHGISNLPKGGIVSLKIQKEETNLLIEVVNTGKLVINKTSTKVGLENIKKRLSLLYGDKANFSLTEVSDQIVAKIEIAI